MGWVGGMGGGGVWGGGDVKGSGEAGTCCAMFLSYYMKSCSFH